MNILSTIRRLVGPLVICCLLVTTAFLAVTTQTASAEGETFVFTSSNTIRASGGGIFPQPGSNERAINLNRQGNIFRGTDQASGGMRYTVSNITKKTTGGYKATVTITSLLGSGSSSYEIHINDPNGVGPNGGSPGPGDPGGGNNNGEEQEERGDDCPVQDDRDEEFRWAVCPLFTGINKFINVIDAFIHAYLSTDNTVFNDEENEQDYRNAWQVFRNFAIVLLVIAGLVMLISEALSLSIIDAYTVRKVLPRLLIAVVGISVSWEFCELLLMLFDDLGRAMGEIIYTSFGLTSKGINIADVITIYLVGILGTPTAVALLLGGFGIISLLGTLVLAMLIGAVVLIFRQAIIVAAVLLAPLAIAAYILPNTSKFANFWWDTLTRMLMLYPIATGIIALCKVMGNIVMGDPTNIDGEGVAGNVAEGLNGVIAFISGMIFFFAGYALIPLAFRLTGGLVATLGGIANDRSRGGFDRLKNFRKSKTEENMAAMREGRRFRGNSWAGSRAFNRASRGMNNFAESKNKLGYFHYNQDRRTSARHAGATNSVINQAAEFSKTKEAQALMENDPALQALTYRNAAEARAGFRRGDFGADMQNEAAIESAIRAVQTGGGWSAARSQFAAKQLFATGTGYESARQAIETSHRVAGSNDGAYADIVGYGNAVTAQKGRLDLKGGFGEYMAQRGAMRAAGTNRVSAAQEQAFYRSAVEGNDAVSFLRGKPQAMTNVSKAVLRHINEAQTVADNATTDEAREAARYEVARYSGIIDTFEQQGAMYAAPQIKQTVHQGMVIPTSGQAVSVDLGPDMPTPSPVNRSAVRSQGQTHVQMRDPTTNQPLVDVRGRPIVTVNRNYSEGAALGSAEQGGGRMDPRAARDRLDE